MIKQTVYFIPAVCGDGKNLSLEGFKYSLNKCHIALGSTLCISNELIHSQGAFRFRRHINNDKKH
ncbi:hypothetical protein PO124_01080 [Bacillus licheniformis]|nr:hypothetical protein [Bacillus licheniformis]